MYTHVYVFKYVARILPRPPAVAALAPAMYYTGTANKGTRWDWWGQCGWRLFKAPRQHRFPQHSCLLCTSHYFILLYYPSVKHIRTQSERQREVRQIQTEFGCDFLLGPDARREAYSHGPCLPMLPKSRTAGLRKSNSLQNIRHTRSQNGKKPGWIAELGRPVKQAFD